MATNRPFCVITNINVRLTVKEKNDAGSAMVPISGPEAGVFIPFNKVFLDVRSITVSAKRNASYPSGVIAIYDFGDERDGGFTAYVFRRDTGAYIGGEVSWTARGV